MAGLNQSEETDYIDYLDMSQLPELGSFYEPWWSTHGSTQYQSCEWYQNDMAGNSPHKAHSAPVPSLPSPTEFLSSDEDLWEVPELELEQSAASSPSTWAFSASTSPSPPVPRQTLPLRSAKAGKGQGSKTEKDFEKARQLSRKAQNRAAQQAHRERKKRLIEELWIEVHSLRNKNVQLTKELQAKTEMLDDFCRRLCMEQAGFHTSS